MKDKKSGEKAPRAYKKEGFFNAHFGKSLKNVKDPSDSAKTKSKGINKSNSHFFGKISV